jgi:hypothetical protein
MTTRPDGTPGRVVIEVAAGEVAPGS